MSGLKIKKGDRVLVLSGKDKGKEGVVQHAYPSERKVVMEGINTARRHDVVVPSSNGTSDRPCRGTVSVAAVSATIVGAKSMTWTSSEGVDPARATGG